MSRHLLDVPVRPEGVRFARGVTFALLSEVVAVAVVMAVLIAVHVAVSGRI